MVKYLSFDGVDDYLQMPGIAITDIYVDLVVKSTSGTLYNVKNGNDTPLIKWSGSSFSQTGTTVTHFTTTITGTTDPAWGISITPNQRMIIHAWKETTWSGTNSALGRTQWSAANYMAMDIYNVKLYNGTTLKAHYDMSTGTVLDQSGNGNHATLTGGTWLDDGTGGSTGTDGSIILGLTQQIYRDVSATLSLTQQIYKESSESLSLLQQIYRDTSSVLSLIQAVYKDADTVLPLTQAIYQDLSKTLNLRQEIYTEGQAVLQLIQEFYEDSQTYITLQLVQEIYKEDYTILRMIQEYLYDHNAPIWRESIPVTTSFSEKPIPTVNNWKTETKPVTYFH